jgi:uncharacterized protein
MVKKTLVIGASENPERYSNKAINMLAKYHHPIVAIGSRKGVVNNIEIVTEKNNIENIDTVTLYLNENRQKDYMSYILLLYPKRIIFNPGAENEEFKKVAEAQGIHCMEACTLVLLSTGQY